MGPGRVPNHRALRVTQSSQRRTSSSGRGVEEFGRQDCLRGAVQISRSDGPGRSSEARRLSEIREYAAKAAERRVLEKNPATRRRINRGANDVSLAWARFFERFRGNHNISNYIQHSSVGHFCDIWIKKCDVYPFLRKLALVQDTVISFIFEYLCDDLCRHVICQIIRSSRGFRECFIDVSPHVLRDRFVRWF